MDNFTKLALSKSIKAKALKEARADLEPGEYEIDRLVYLKGQLTIGNDTEKAATSSIPWIAIAARLLKRMGATEGAARDMLFTVAKEALEDKSSLVGFETEIAALKREIASKLPKMHVKGAVEFSGTIEDA